MLEMARAFAFGMNELGIACRFITVDADIDYEPNTLEFYKKNGFVENLKCPAAHCGRSKPHGIFS